MQIKKRNLIIIPLKTPHINLLKARLFFDGGYSKQAVEELEKINSPNFFNHSKNNLEYFYRYGRCMEQMGKDEVAIKYYKKTVLAGSEEPYYFAAKAALQIALLYEDSNNINEAKRYLIFVLKWKTINTSKE